MVKHKILEYSTKAGKACFINIREDVRQAVKESGVTDGIVSVQSMHTTCSVFFEEMVHDTDYRGDEYLQVDLVHALEKILPKEDTDAGMYRYPGPAHTEFGRTHDPEVAKDISLLLNGDAHLKATLVGSSVTFSLIGGELQTGDWGYIYFADWDSCRERKRRVIVTVVGE